MLSLLILNFACTIGWGGIFLSYFSILINGDNVPILNVIIPYFSYSSIPIGAFVIVEVVWSLTGDTKTKKRVLFLFALYLLVYYLVLYSTFEQAVICPDTPTGIIIDDWITPNSFFYYILWGVDLFASVATISAFNKLRKATSGKLSKRMGYLMYAAPLIAFGILLDTVILADLFSSLVFIPRIFMIVGFIFLFKGFKPPRDKIVETKYIKMDKLDNVSISSIESMFAAKPSKISEEEVTFYREQKICLICKGKVVKFNFICECDALYCFKCATALIEIENLCWACNNPLDESEPVKPYQKEKEPDLDYIKVEKGGKK
jgi:hypothetical protein